MTFFNICPNSGPSSRDVKLLESRLKYVPVSQALTKRLNQHLTYEATGTLSIISAERSQVVSERRGLFVLLGSLSSDSASPGENQEGRMNY